MNDVSGNVDPFSPVFATFTAIEGGGELQPMSPNSGPFIYRGILARSDSSFFVLTHLFVFSSVLESLLDHAILNLFR